MTDRRQALLENLEDAKLALLLDDYADACARADLECYEQELRQGRIPEISEEEIREKYDAFIKRVEREENKVKRRRSLPLKLLRRVGAAAAIIAIFFSMLIAVQAAGIDVFGAIGRWTNDHLIFRKPNSEDLSVEDVTFVEKERSLVSEIRMTVLENDLPLDYCPTWLPSGYHLVETNRINNSCEDSVVFTLSSEEKQFIVIRIGVMEEANENILYYEKDDADPEQYVSGNKLFYLYTNSGKWAAVWSDDTHIFSITGCESHDVTQKIINSIGENTSYE